MFSFYISSISGDLKRSIKYSYNLITHITCIIFKAYIKTNYNFFIFFLFMTMITKYYQKNKERHRKEARKKDQNPSEQKKKKGEERPQKMLKF